MSEVEVTEIIKTVVKWGSLEAHIVKGKLAVNLPETPEEARLLCINIQEEPYKLAKFGAALAKAMEDTKPPEPPKERKTRSDKGKKKSEPEVELPEGLLKPRLVIQ